MMFHPFLCDAENPKKSPELPQFLQILQLLTPGLLGVSRLLNSSDEN
jgi:hypothetical protein